MGIAAGVSFLGRTIFFHFYIPLKAITMTRILIPSLAEGQSRLAGLPIPPGNKSPVLVPGARQLLSVLLTSFPAQEPLGFDIVNIPLIKVITVQSGHPFTVGTDTIVFPREYFTLPVKQQRTILAHELVHLHQRKHPVQYYRYYRKLGFLRAQVEFSPALAQQLMYNPDGEHYEWIWLHRGKGYVPFSVNHKAYVGLLGKVHRIKSLTPIAILPVEQVPEYYNHFQTVRQLYHPNEIVAHQITDRIR